MFSHTSWLIFTHSQWCNGSLQRLFSSGESGIFWNGELTWKIQVRTFRDGCKQGIDQQIFNRKSISRKITHPQSLWFYLNKDWGCVILCEIDFVLKICWSIPCLHPSWKVRTWIEICASLNHCKKTKADGSRRIPRKHTETLVLLSVARYGNTAPRLILVYLGTAPILVYLGTAPLPRYL